MLGPLVRVGRTIRRFFVDLARQLRDHDIDDLAAMMTYYAIMALFPMVLFVFAVALLVLPAPVIRDTAASLTAPLPSDVGAILRAQIENMREASNPGLAVLGGGLALWSASRGASGLTTALNRVFSKRETRPWVYRQLRAVVVTALVAAIVVVALACFVIAPELGVRLAGRLSIRGDAFDTAWWIARWIGAGVLATLLWSLLYQTLPDTNAPLRVFTPGALVGVVLWIVVSRGLTFFIEYISDFQDAYGAFASVIIVLLWLWLSNLTLLIGAEISAVIAAMRAEQSPAAAALSDPTEHEATPPVAPEAR